MGSVLSKSGSLDSFHQVWRIQHSGIVQCSPSIAKQCRETKLGRESLQLHTKPQFPERRDRDTARTAGL